MNGGKKISFGAKPKAKDGANAWVDQKQGKETKRLTLDIPLELHREIKSQCALRGVKMVDDIKEMLEEKYLSAASESK